VVPPAVCAVGLACAGHAEGSFWAAFTREAERKLGSFTFQQLAEVLESIAHAG